MNAKLAELSEEELAQVTGGVFGLDTAPVGTAHVNGLILPLGFESASHAGE